MGGGVDVPVAVRVAVRVGVRVSVTDGEGPTVLVTVAGTPVGVSVVVAIGVGVLVSRGGRVGGGGLTWAGASSLWSKRMSYTAFDVASVRTTAPILFKVTLLITGLSIIGLSQGCCSF